MSKNNLTFTEGKVPRELLELPTLHFVVIDQWLDVLGEKAFLSWLKMYTWCKRDEDTEVNQWEQAKIPTSYNKVIKRLGVGKATFYNQVLKPLWNVGLIDIEEYEGSEAKGNKPMNIIVYKYPQNRKTLSYKPIEIVRDYDKDYHSKAKTFAERGGRPSRLQENPSKNVDEQGHGSEIEPPPTDGSEIEPGVVLRENQGWFREKTRGGSDIEPYKKGGSERKPPEIDGSERKPSPKTGSEREPSMVSYENQGWFQEKTKDGSEIEHNNILNTKSNALNNVNNTLNNKSNNLNVLKEEEEEKKEEYRINPYVIDFMKNTLRYTDYEIKSVCKEMMREGLETFTKEQMISQHRRMLEWISNNEEEIREFGVFFVGGILRHEFSRKRLQTEAAARKADLNSSRITEYPQVPTYNWLADE